jgi:hypothetical protein
MAFIIRVIALMMEAASSSETSVNFYRTTRCYNPEDSHIHARRRENLKSYVIHIDAQHRTPVTFTWSN